MLPWILAAFAFCFVLERVIPGWKLPKVDTWPLRVVLVILIQLGVVLLAGFTWARWLSAWSVFHLSNRVGPLAGGFIAYFIATCGFDDAREQRLLPMLAFRDVHRRA